MSCSSFGFSTFVYQKYFGFIAFDCCCGKYCKPSQHVFLYEQKEHSFPNTLFPVTLPLKVSSISSNCLLNGSLLFNALRFFSACSSAFLECSSSFIGVSTIAHSPEDLSIAIHPPKSTPSAFEYKYPCDAYPNKSSFTTASNPSKNLYLNA